MVRDRLHPQAQARLAFWLLLLLTAGLVAGFLFLFHVQGLSPRDGWCWGALKCTRTYGRWLYFIAFLLMAGSLVGILLSAWQQAARTRWLLGRSPVVPLAWEPRLQRLARRARAEGTVELAQTPAPEAFTYGWFFPRVRISRSLVALLEDHELAALLEHELHHARRRDPLRLACARALRDGFFYVPAAAEIVRAYEVAVELSADEAAEHAGGAAGLAGALLKVVGKPHAPAVPPAVVAGWVGTVDHRILRLLGRERPPLGRLSRLALLALAVLVAFLLAGYLGRCH